jgi:hypothetical protein
MAFRLFRRNKQEPQEGEQEQQAGAQQQQQLSEEEEQQQGQQQPAMAFITDGPPTTWTEQELAAGRANFSSDETYELSFSKQNPTPGKCTRSCPACNSNRCARGSLLTLDICRLTSKPLYCEHRPFTGQCCSNTCCCIPHSCMAPCLAASFASRWSRHQATPVQPLVP